MSAILRLTGFVAGFLTTLVLTAAASANYTDYHWSTSGPGWKGTRVTVDNPDSSQASVSSGDFFLTSALANSGSGGSSLIQIGVTLEYKDPQPPTCNLGMNSPALYYFIEIEQTGNYSCYGPTAATYSTSHLQSVVRGSDGIWRSYRDGNPAGITNTWTGCSGDACKIAAFAEENKFTTGRWAAKYAGSGNTPWQFWNGSTWNTINTPTWQPGTYWSPPNGPFPGGIWSFTYSH